MCWSAEVSLNTFLFSLFGASFAYFNGVISGFSFLYLLSFISMQLLEYFTWKNINDKKANRLLSKIGLFLIFIQIPLFIYSRENFKYKPSLLGIYLLFSLSVFYFDIDFSMNKAPNGHLAWNWLNFPPIIYLIYVSFFLGLCLYQERYLSFILYFIIIGGIYYTYNRSNTWGSLWCWIANAISFKLIGEVFLKKTFKKIDIII